jgi:micrococcal nuclease
LTNISFLIKTLHQNLIHFFHDIVLLAILLTALPVVCIANTALLSGCIVRVVDGDTVKLMDGDLDIHTIRLAGIDAPESKMPYGKQASAFLTALILGKDVVAVPYKQDRHGRTIATIFLHGKDINLAIKSKSPPQGAGYDCTTPRTLRGLSSFYSALRTLCSPTPRTDTAPRGGECTHSVIEAGLAWHYKKYASEQPRSEALAYARGELMARQNKLALWSDEEPIAPWEWRMGHQSWRNRVSMLSMKTQSSY